MKKYWLFLERCVIFCILFSSFNQLYASSYNGDNKIRICTYNIRGDLPNDGMNSWEFRKDSLCKIIDYHDFDIVCMQEVLANQLKDIEERTDYSFVGIRGLYNPIFYKASRFEMLHWEMFWLSETMLPCSVGWDGRYDRYCTWVKFLDKKTQQIFYVFNTHLDHKGKIAQKCGAELVVKQSKEIAGDNAVFITGDMNSYDTTDAYKEYSKFYNDSFKIAPLKSGPVGTAHNFGKVTPVRIDYIFVNDAISVSHYFVEDEQYENGFYPSDHYAVFIDCVLK